MYIVMNRFRVIPGKEAEFEKMWRERDSYLADVPGFLGFHLLRGPTGDDHTLFASHTMWQSEDAFADWTRSEAFRKAHANAGRASALYAGASYLEMFDVVQESRPNSGSSQ